MSAPPSRPLPQHDRLRRACPVRNRLKSLRLRSKSDPDLIRGSGCPRVPQFKSFCWYLPCRKRRNSLCIRGNESNRDVRPLSAWKITGRRRAHTTVRLSASPNAGRNICIQRNFPAALFRQRQRSKIHRQYADRHKEKRFLARPVGDLNVNPQKGR